ncbi:hypothetical protein KAZ66_05670 [Candidatus Woesebacteria bacterium]|nr:hypothetical protein [Candidatus Woesebacteria bacterium]
MKKSSILTLLIIIAILGYNYYLKQSQSTPITETPATTPSVKQFILSNPDTSILRAGGSSYTDPQSVYTFLYPNEYSIDHHDGDTITRISKRGATQKGQTEMYDGVIMVFQLVDLENKTLSSWVDNHIKEMTSDGTSELTQPKKAIAMYEYPGFTYGIRSLGESTYLLVQKDTRSKFALNITFLVADPELKDYQKEVDAILATLELRK